MMKLKSVFIAIQLLIQFLFSRTFGNILHDISLKYPDITIWQLRKYEKLRLKVNKATLDITFLKNCKPFGVTPKFLFVNLPGGERKFILKRLLKSVNNVLT